MIDIEVVYFSVVIVTLTYLVSEYSTYRRRASLVAKNGCKPPPAIQQSKWLNGADMAHGFMTLLDQGRFLQETSRYFRTTARTFTIQFIGATRIWTIEPANVRAILQSDDFEMGWVRLKAFHPWIGNGVQATNGAAWSHGRALLRPCFSRAQISNLTLYEEHFQHLAALLLPADGAPVDIQKAFHRLTMDVATEILFGESVRSLQPGETGEAREIEEAFEYTTRGVIQRFNMGNLIWFHWDPRFRRSTELLKRYVQRFVEKAVRMREELGRAGEEEDEQEGGRYIFIKALAKDTGDRIVLRDHMLSMMLAGRGTTASLLSLTFYLLARHPEVLKKLRDEIVQLKGQPPTFEQLKHMPYMKAVLDETLRTHPSAPQNERAAKRDTILPLGGGADGKSPVFVRRGQTVFYHTYALHRSEELWGEDAAVFRPERWLEARENVGVGKEGGDSKGKGAGAGWKFVPFGGGGRICPGQQLALTESSYFITRILQTFSVLENRDDAPFEEGLGVVFNSGRGVKVSLRR